VVTKSLNSDNKPLKRYKFKYATVSNLLTATNSLMYAFSYIYIYIYIYRERERERERERIQVVDSEAMAYSGIVQIK
jgi:hypothetical protein